MFERMILTIAIVSISALVFVTVQAVQRRRLTLVADAQSAAILYFRSDVCAPCVTQKRFLEELQAKCDVKIETIDVLHEPEKASKFNVMTLPTTIVVGDGGQVKEINYGLADASKLARQLA